MGRIRTKNVKRAARQIVEKYYPKLTYDFQINKKIAGEVASIPSKRLRNKIAGFVTHLMGRISKGEVRGISLKLQQQERERRLDTVPAKSYVDVNGPITVDELTKKMVQELRIGVQVEVPKAMMANRPTGGRGDGPRQNVAGVPQ